MGQVILSSLVLLGLCFSAQAYYTIDLQFMARGLPLMDVLPPSPADAFIDVFVDRGQGRTLFATTSVISDNANPDWPGIYRLYHTDGAATEIHLEIMDDDGALSPQAIGTVSLSLESLLTNPAPVFTIEGASSGTLTVKATVSPAKKH